MLRVGLTGGLACGKTTVARLFAERGLHVIEADKIAHDLMQYGKPIYTQVVRSFGEGILTSAGSAIDRAKLAALVFDPAAPRVEELNAIVHPGVIEAQEAWMAEIAKSDPKGIAIVEAALIFEAGVTRRFDKLIVVTCPKEVKLERYAQRVVAAMERSRGTIDAPTRAELLLEARTEGARRIAKQVPDEVKAEAADFVIANDASIGDLGAKVDSVIERLRTF